MPPTPSISNLSKKKFSEKNRWFSVCGLVNAVGVARIVVIGLLAVVVASGPIACGLESDGSHKTARSGRADTPQMLGRYRTEAVRLGVNRPLFLLIDTATGRVLQRSIVGTSKFRPVTDDPAPGANLRAKIPGRYDVKVVPGRRGSGLLRLDTITGETWFTQLGASQRKWQALPSSLDDEAQKPETLSSRSGGSPDTEARLLAGTGQKKPPIEAYLEVLTEPGHQTELRVWTASRMAGHYPSEAAELLTGALESDHPKVMIAIIEGVALGADGRVRTALESLRGHENAKVAEAIREKLAASD